MTRSLSRRRCRARRGSVIALIVGALGAGCGMEETRITVGDAAALTGGDPRAGREKIRQYGCDACHTVPGIRGADRKVGPPLVGVSERMYLAGVVTHTPENLVAWIRNPPAFDPLTAMPNLGVSDRDARDIAAYLYSRR